MRYLYAFGYNVINIDRALTLLQEKDEIPAKTVVLTFDDGFESFYYNAYPLLKKFNFPAIVYLVSRYIGAKASWLDFDRGEAPLMQKKHLLELHKKGIDFGAHSVSHKRLTHLKPSEQDQEIYESKKDLENIFGQEIKHFCYPYGDYNLQVMERVRKAGFHSAVTCLRASACSDFDHHELPRKAISFGDTLPGFWWKLHMKHKPKTEPLSKNCV
jgi:peptidoglycan/xylan/chitin deacetylase (PgdA/CDA1 family)